MLPALRDGMLPAARRTAAAGWARVSCRRAGHGDDKNILAEEVKIRLDDGRVIVLAVDRLKVLGGGPSRKRTARRRRRRMRILVISGRTCNCWAGGSPVCTVR